jgi:tetrahydromethanopterin S-methyltransferase subunit D
MNKLILIVIVSFFSTLAYAQDKPEMADVMRSNGKIYDVVAVCLTILIGLFIYVFIVDRKISKIEKNK